MPSLATPPVRPWNERQHGTDDPDDPRSPYARDRDRILHSSSFRQLQYKTQVYIVSDGDYYRTRITHSLEVAQLARSLARLLDLCEDLAEAIALGHDVGHTPFGHAGEQALDGLLKERNVPAGWNSNTHSLTVVDKLEFEDPRYDGLNLTYATRQGIARHHTPFDEPASDFDDWPQPTLEAQVVNVADLLAYVAHDTEDAVVGGLLDIEQLEEGGNSALRLWRRSISAARREFETAGRPLQGPSGEEQRRLLQRGRRHFINDAVLAVRQATLDTIRRAGIADQDEAMRYSTPLVHLPAALEEELEELATYLLGHVYRSPVVSRQNYRERYILRNVFTALAEDDRSPLLPDHYRKRLLGTAATSADRPRIIAQYIASLSDRALQDLYAELFDPRERTMARRN